MNENTRFKDVIITDAGVDEIIELIRETLGDWHAYYAEASVKSGIARGLQVKTDKKTIGGIIYYKVGGSFGSILIIYYIATTRESRRRGVASLLLREIEKREKPTVLLATISPGNKPSISFFKGNGFEVLSYDEIKKKYGKEILYRITRLTCGYEDEYAAIKPPKTSWKLIELINWSSINEIFEEICYKPWKRIHQ